jgi:transcriptional/translational regulatory protein YebC/TACO1
MTLLAADLGAEDVEEVNDLFEIYTDPADLHVMKQKLTELGFKVTGAEIVRRPINLVSITDEGMAKRALSFMDFLEESDDVQKVFSNFDIPLDLLAKITASS